MTDILIASVEDAIAAIKNGEFVIVVDDEDRENEGDLVIAAEFCTAEKVNFMVTHGRGLVCIAMQSSMLDRLQLPMMIPQSQNRSGFGTGFTVSVEATKNVSTGISAPDRAQTIKTLIDPTTKPEDIAVPGHMFPLRAREGGVLERRGQTEASVDLARLAELTPAGVICEIMDEQGEMMRLAELCAFAKQHNMLITTVDAIAEYRQQSENASNDITVNKLPTEHGTFDISVFRDQQGREHSLLSMGDVAGTAPLVRLHSECLTGDAFGSLRCDCGEQLQSALKRIADNGSGALVYLRQEGRGIGLGNKIRAYELQDTGVDTVDANHQLGFPADAREYDTAALMLKSVGVNEVKLMTNNPEKVNGLKALGINVVEQLAHQVAVHEHNATYLQTKADRMGHELN
ncbi:UNVERIFIED_CONTAM: hypothetical protein GTU68_005948 [Idotea baltica]|nr:hypothetical protein [Idotea baltica]